MMTPVQFGGLTEARVIDLLTRNWPAPWRAHLQDDTAYLPEPSPIVTIDTLVEGKHFDMDYFTPSDLGWKVAAVNISDIAAMGGRLNYILLAMALPKQVNEDFVLGLSDGLKQAVEQHNGQIVGGDTTGTKNGITLTVTALGSLPKGHHLGRRNAAEKGDVVVTTGFHGLSQLGLLAFQQNLTGYDVAKQAHLRPQPQLEAGLSLSKTVARYALMDSSDGLANALINIAEASGVTIEIDRNKVSVHPELTKYYKGSDEEALWHTVLYGGEDFQLVATIPDWDALDSTTQSQFSVIGRVTDNTSTPTVTLLDAAGNEAHRMDMDRAYQHFATGNEETTQ